LSYRRQRSGTQDGTVDLEVFGESSERRIESFALDEGTSVVNRISDVLLGLVRGASGPIRPLRGWVPSLPITSSLIRMPVAPPASIRQ